MDKLTANDRRNGAVASFYFLADTVTDHHTPLIGCLPSTIMVQLDGSPPPPVPVYDIDELVDGVNEPPLPLPLYDIEAILATLTLEEARESQCPPTYSLLPTAAPPRTPTPPPRTPTPPPRRSSSLYMFHSPNKSGFSTDWYAPIHAVSLRVFPAELFTGLRPELPHRANLSPMCAPSARHGRTGPKPKLTPFSEGR